MSRLAVCFDAAREFQVGAADARAIIRGQVAIIRDRWSAVCDEAGLSAVDRGFLWGRQFLNPFAFEGLPDDILA